LAARVPALVSPTTRGVRMRRSVAAVFASRGRGRCFVVRRSKRPEALLLRRKRSSPSAALCREAPIAAYRSEAEWVQICSVEHAHRGALPSLRSARALLPGFVIGGIMNDRIRNERNESDFRGTGGRGRGESGWREHNRSDFRADPYEPQYSDAEDGHYGSSWAADRGDYGGHESRSNDLREGGRRRQHSNVGHWGSGGRAGYSGGHASGGYGGSSGTNYDRDHASRGTIGGTVSQGGSQGYSGQDYGDSHSQSYRGSPGQFGASGDYRGSGDYGGSGSQRRFARGALGQGFEQRYGGRDLSSRGADLRPGGGFAGRGPKGYTRTDDRIREDVCERLSHDDDVDASEIEVSVKDGEVTLRGMVMTRGMKHDAEDLAEEVSGVKDVHNELRVMKSVVSELKDKLTGEEKQQHFANTGTKNSPASPSSRHS
jgi:osmotically-inducible protein OsmY